MKKLLILLAILIPLTCFAASQHLMMAIIAKKGITCQSGTYMFAYNGDYAGDTDKACFTSGGASKDGTIVDVTVTSSYIEYSAAADYITWINASEDGLADEQGTLYFSLYLIDDGNGDVDSNGFFESIIDADNKMYLYTADASNNIGARHEGGGTGNMVWSPVVSFNTWYRVGYTWQTGADTGGKHAISMVALGNAPSWDDEDIEDLDNWTSAPDDITIGENASERGVTDTVRIKDICILSGYKDTDVF